MKLVARDPYRSAALGRVYLGESLPQLIPWLSDVTFVAYPKSGLNWLRTLIFVAAENHATASMNIVSSYSELRRQFPFLPSLAFTHAGSSWQGRVLDEADLNLYSPGEWASGGKIVFAHRDPREVLTDAFHDLCARFDLHHVRPADIIENRVVGVRKMVRFVIRWRGWCAHNPNCVMVDYEDLRTTTASELKKVSQFCGFGFSDKTIEIACRAVSHESMQLTALKSASSRPWGGALATSQAQPGGRPAHAGASAYAALFTSRELKRIEEILADETEVHQRHSQ